MTCISEPAPGRVHRERANARAIPVRGGRLLVGGAVAIATALLALWFVWSPAHAQEATPAPVAVPVADMAPPSIQPVANVVWPATDATGALIELTLPLAVDGHDGPVPVSCNHPVGDPFPLGDTLVTCLARDLAGNVATVEYWVTVVDQTPPVIGIPASISVDAVDPAGAEVWWEPPSAIDNVDGAVAVWCDWVPGAFFPVGTTTVTCWAQDATGNIAAAVGFLVVVNALPPPLPLPTPDVVVDPPPLPPTEEPPPTLVPTPTLPPTGTEVAAPDAPPVTEPAVTGTPAVSIEPSPVPTLADALPNLTPAPTTDAPAPTPEPTPTPTPDDSAPPPPAEPVEEPAREALELPWPPPDAFTIVTDGGPLGELAAIWGYQEFPISQEFGHTEFSIMNFSWYRYGLDYGLDGYEHPGIDIAMPAGTWLYSPVEGTVEISGGTPYYTYYGNGDPNVGELLIRTDGGDEVILGHMGRIAVNVGDRVHIGQFVGLSGGDNGDHLHLEVRERLWNWYRIVDPRRSVVMDVLRAEAQRNAALAVPTPSPAAIDDRSTASGTRRRPKRPAARSLT